MANFSGSSIFNILTTQFVPRTGAAPLDATHTFTSVDGVNLGQFEILHFYGDQTITAATNVASTYFSDVTANQDSIMCIRVFHGNLSITSNTFAPPFRTKGMFVLVKGNLTIGTNGVISMTGRGSNAAGQNVAIWQGATIPAGGSSGAASQFIDVSASTNVGFGTGTNAANGVAGGHATSLSRATGGGGGGAIHAFVSTGGPFRFTAGSGTPGTSWSGGNGGGALAAGSNSDRTSGNATSSQGGAGVSTRTSTPATARRAGGGAGITAGAGTFTATGQTVGAGSETSSANTGAGGLLIVACLNNIQFLDTTSRMTSNGVGDGGLSTLNATTPGSGQFIAPGGSSGGGSINVIFRTSNQTPTALIGTNASSSWMSATGGSSVTASGSALDGTNAYSISSGAGGRGSLNVGTFTADGVTLPRRTLINVDGTYYYRDFNIAVGQPGAWKVASGTGTTPFEQFGMFDGEVYALDKATIVTISGIVETAVRFEVYTP